MEDPDKDMPAEDDWKQKMESAGDDCAGERGSKELFETKLQLGIAQNTIEQLRADAVKKDAVIDALEKKKDAVIDTLEKKKMELIEVSNRSPCMVWLCLMTCETQENVKFCFENKQLCSKAADVDTYMKDNAQLVVDVKFLREEKVETNAEFTAMKRKFADVNEEHGTLKKLYDDLKGDNVRLAVHLHDKKTQLEELKAPKETIAELKKELKLLTEQHEGLTRYINKNDI
jgi:hypothetical protein